jgi:hypothetical protein
MDSFVDMFDAVTVGDTQVTRFVRHFRKKVMIDFGNHVVNVVAAAHMITVILILTQAYVGLHIYGHRLLAFWGGVQAGSCTCVGENVIIFFWKMIY